MVRLVLTAAIVALPSFSTLPPRYMDRTSGVTPARVTLNPRSGRPNTDEMYLVSDRCNWQGFSAEMNGTQMQRMKKIPALGTNRLGLSYVHAQSSVDMKRCRQRVHELRELTVQVGVVRHHAEIRDLDPGLHAQDNVDGSMTAIATCGQADTLSLSLDFIPALAGDEIRLEHIDVHQRGRCTPRLVRALKLPQARVRCTPRLARALKLPQARVRCTPRLARALKLPQARVRCTPRLARTLKLPQARVRCTPRLGLDRHVHVGHAECLEHEMRHVLQDGQGVHKGGLVYLR